MKKLALFILSILTVGIQLTNAQVRSISGTVTSAEDGTAIPGVSVLVRGTTIGTVTNIDGYYELDVPEDADVLTFSFVGMKNVELRIEGAVINATMEADVLGLDEVMVVAFGTTTKEAFTGSAEVIGSRELETRAVTSPISAIEGATTGVQVLSASGQPGSSPEVIIRGVGTLNGTTNPLYVVDGVQYEGALTNLNAEDIESMTILKDAASTALYGARAANGVVLITTKNGKRGAGIKINASAQIGMITPAVPFYDAASPGEYYELMWESYKNALIASGSSAEEAIVEASASIFNRLAYNPFNVPNDNIVGTGGKLNPNANVKFKSLDWYDALQQTGQRENYSVNVSGGGEKHDVYFSTSYLDEKGYIIQTNYDRLTSRFNANFTPNKWLKLGANLNIAMSNQEGPFSRGSAYANPFFFAKTMGSVYPVYVVDPATGDYILDEAGEKQYDFGEGYAEYGIAGRPSLVGRHTVAEVNWNSDVRKTNNVGARYNAEVILFPGLTAGLNYGIDVNDYIKKEYENNLVGDGAPAGRYNENRYRRTVKNFNQIVTYTNRLESGHNIDVTLGHESFDRHYSENSGMKNTQTVTGIYEFDNFSTVSDLSGYSSDKRNEGYFARLNYNYMDKYYISGSARRDGSSVFNKDVRWGNFFSVGGSWRIDQENFMANVSFVDQLKIRASFGQVGQDNLNDFYISQPRYSLLPNAGEPGVFWSDLGNNALTWETSESWDVALDFALFDNFIDGSVEFFRKNSSDLLYNVPLPLSMGLSVGPDNIASLYNQGLEIGLTGHFVRTNDLIWDLTLQGTTVKSEITDIPDPFIDGSKRWDVGYSRFDYFIYDYAGVDPENGDALFYMYDDETEDGIPVRIMNDDGTYATSNDYTDAGKGYVGETSLPDFYGSVRNNLSYKGFALDFVLTYSIGGKILDYGYADMMNEGVYGEALHPDLLNGWRSPGDVTDIPRMENGNTDLVVRMSTRFLTDASYVALRNANLSYTFNSQFVKTLGLNSVKVFVVGENLLLKSARKGLNPTYNISGTPDGRDYNPSRVVSFGVNVSL
jgi:TonB-linked SusC/RagA family outer membrane protein